MKDVTLLKDILEKSKYMTLATSTKDGQPWISPLFFAYDDKLNIYWSSAINAEHSKLIQENSNVALVIYNAQMTDLHWHSLYITGTANPVTDEEFIDALKIYYDRGHPLLIEDEKHILFAKDFSGDAPRRLYKCTPEHAYLLNPPITRNDQLIETRIEIDLDQLLTE